jgi:hypothetical protein
LDSERCTERVCVSAGALAFGLLPNPREERCERHRERLCVKGLGYWRFFFSFFFIIIIFFFFLFMGGNAESVRVADSVKIDQLSIAVKVKQTSS